MYSTTVTSGATPRCPLPAPQSPNVASTSPQRQPHTASIVLSPHSPHACPTLLSRCPHAAQAAPMQSLHFSSTSECCSHTSAALQTTQQLHAVAQRRLHALLEGQWEKEGGSCGKDLEVCWWIWRKCWGYGESMIRG